MKSTYHFYSFQKITEEICVAFLDEISKYHIDVIGRDFSNLFFYFFIKRYYELLEKYEDVILTYDEFDNPDISCVFTGFAVFIKNFHKKIHNMFPTHCISSDKHGSCAVSDLSHEDLQQLFESYKKTFNYKKVRGIIEKNIKQVEDTLKIYKMFVFYK
jgi:hypothetical protein